MYGKEEIKELKKQFWDAFDSRMKKHRSANNGSKVNWAHYRTNINHVYFRIETNNDSVAICVDLQHKDDGIRELFYEQFTELRVVMQSYFSQELGWHQNYKHSNGLTVSRISCTLNNCHYLDPKQHTQILDFLEKNLVGLDEFWVEYNEILYQLK